MNTVYTTLYENPTLTNSKPFQTLIDTLHYQPEKTAIICPDSISASSMQKTCTNKHNVGHSALYLSKTWIFDHCYQHNRHTHNSILHQAILQTCHMQSATPLTEQLSQSHLYRKNVIELALLLQTSKIPLENTVNYYPAFEQNSLHELLQLIALFKTLLQDHYSLSLNTLYNTLLTPVPLLTHINTLVFCDCGPEFPWEKRAFSHINTHIDTLSFILPKEGLANTQDYLSIKFPESPPVTDNSPKIPYKTPIHCYQTLQDELHVFNNSIDAHFKKNPSTPLYVVIPSDRALTQTIQKHCLKHSIQSAYLNPQKNPPSPLLASFQACLTFLSTPFSISSIKTLSNTPGCTHLNHNDTPSLLDTHALEQALQENANNPKKTTVLETIKTLIEHNRPDLKPQYTTTQALKQHHDSIHNSHCPESWLTAFTQFTNALLLPTTEKPYNTALKQLSDFLCSYTQLKGEHVNTHFFYHSCHQYLTHTHTPPLPENTHILFTSLAETQFMSNKHVIILGLSESLHTHQPPENPFISTPLQRYINIPHPAADHRHHLLQNLELNNTLLQASMSKTIENTTHIPLLNWPNITATPQKKTTPTTTEPPKTPPSDPLPAPPSEQLKTHTKSLLKKTLSATLLDTYQSCPYKFYLSRVLNLSPIDPNPEEIAKTDWGIMVHDIMATFNHWIKENPSANHSEIQTKLTQISHKKLSNLCTQSLAWEAKSQSLHGSSKHPSMIEQISQIITDNARYKHPSHIEESITVTLKNGQQLKSKADLVIKHQNQTLLIDYKTGKTLPSGKDIETGRSIQLPLYLLTLKKAQKTLPSAGIYFQIHNPFQIEEKIACCTKPAKEDLLENSKKRPFLYNDSYFDSIETHIETLISLLKQAYFAPEFHPHLTPSNEIRPKTCTFCDYKHVCRYKKRFKQ